MGRTVAITVAVLAAIGAELAWLLASSFPDASNTGYRVTCGRLLRCHTGLAKFDGCV